MTYGNNLYISPKGIKMIDTRGTLIISHDIRISDRDIIRVAKGIRQQFTVQITTEKNGLLTIPRIKKVILENFGNDNEPLIISETAGIILERVN